jgi:Polyphosphate kinase C-terminal domain 2/Polyphosphate kinase C-terminal domain 1
LLSRKTLWVAIAASRPGPVGGRLVRIDAHSGEVERVLRLPVDPYQLAFGFGSLWVTGYTSNRKYQDRLLRIDPTTGRVLRAIRGPRVLGSKVATTSAAVWINGADIFPNGHSERAGIRFVYKVDPRRSAVVRRIQLPSQATVIDLMGAGSSLWSVGWWGLVKLSASGRVLFHEKTHAKLCLAVRAEEEGLRRYAHIGTGNYNPDTAQIYEDVGLFTADPEMTADVSDVFNLLTGHSRNEKFRTLLVAPAGMRSGLLELIRRQASAEGRIAIKLNNLADPELIDALYEAAEAGARIDLYPRSICRLRPGVAGLSETIRVRSLVGRYLEHSRIFRFGSGHEATYLLGSADLMQRNLDRRVEVLAPVSDQALRKRLDEMFDLLDADDTLAWKLMPDGTWRPPSGGRGINAQTRLEQVALARARRIAAVATPVVETPT